MATFKPTTGTAPTPQGKKFENNFKKTMNQYSVNLSEVDSSLNEVEQSLKKKIFSLAKMEALVFSDPKLSSIYEEMAENGEEKYGYHYNETIQNMIFNDYVLNSPKYLQKYKQAQPKEKKRRDKSGINQLKKKGEEMQTRNLTTKPAPKPVTEADEQATKVLFLVNEKDPNDPDLFAYFPEEEGDRSGNKTAYSHVGQHSAASPAYAEESREATPEEYQDLKAELEGLGYNLDVLNGMTEEDGGAMGGAIGATSSMSSGQYTGPLGMKKQVQEDEGDYDIENRPDTLDAEADCVISSNGWKYSLSCGGAFEGDFNEVEQALARVKEWKKENHYYPNTWFVSDHGNESLIDDEGNIINETTGSASSGAYYGPAMWGSGDLMKTKGKSKAKTVPMVKGGTIIGENYLVDPKAFERFVEVLNESISEVETPMDASIIDKTSAFTSNTVKNWNVPDTELEYNTLKTGTPDQPNLSSMEENLNEFYPDALIGNDVVDILPRAGEKPFMLAGSKWEFETATYDSGKKDIIVYSYKDDVYYDYPKWREAMGINENMDESLFSSGLQGFSPIGFIMNYLKKNHPDLFTRADERDIMDANQDIVGTSLRNASPRKLIAYAEGIYKSKMMKEDLGFDKTAQNFMKIKREIEPIPQGADFREQNGKMMLLYYGSNPEAKSWAENVSAKFGIPAYDTNRQKNIQTMNEVKKIEEKAKSVEQQRLFGMAHAVQKGELPASKVSGAVKKIAKDVSPKDVEDFASTKHKGLPEKVTEETQTMIGDSPDSISNKATPVGQQSANIDMGVRSAGGGGMSESYESLLEEINKELDAFSIHHDKLKRMAEDRKPSALVLRDRVGSENEKNFKSDLKDSSIAKEVDIENSLEWKDQQTDVPKNPYELGEKLEKGEIKSADMKSGEALKNVGDSANDKGDEIPKRNLSDEEQDEVNLYRLGLGDLVYDNEVGKRFEDRMKADMGDKLYKQRQDKLAFRAKAPMYNKDTQPVETGGIDKVQFDKEKTGWNEREGIKESHVSGKYFDVLGKKKIIDFNLNEVLELKSTKRLSELKEVSLEGLGNTYTQKVSVNEGFVKAIGGFRFFTNGTDVFALKNPVQNLSEAALKTKPVVNEQMDKMKHLVGYNTATFVKQSKINE